MRTKYLIFLLPFIFFACKKTINPKKEAFYCKINGKDFIPEVDKSPIGGVGSSPLKISWDRTNGWLYIDALNRPENVSLYLKLNPNEEITVKEYSLENDLKKSTGNYYYNILAEPQDKERLLSTTGKVIITKIEGTTIWGTFEFKTKSTKTNQEYTISEGQFNELRYF
jgi:hypothetical protein